VLARRLTTILPAMTLTEAIETTRIHRVAGLTGERTALVTTRPFRAPHHTISDAGLIGGGFVKNVTRLSQPQACSLVPVHGQGGGHFLQTKAQAGTAAGRGVAGAPRQALLGCAAGVPPPRARMAAPAARERHHIDTISRASWISQA
jgi:Magnesium chelatase, subunit ChlI